MASTKRNQVTTVLTAAAILLMVVFYYTPVWWVSLTAPNYPAEAFPDGVRIHFHLNGVFNGCKKVEKTEITETEALDCVHEMDTINHYVGMYPIASGGVLETAFSPFLLSMVVIMLFGFMILNPKVRTAVMAVGFIGLAVWMYMAWYGEGGLKYLSSGYLEARVTALDQDASTDSGDSGGNAIVERLRESLRASGVDVDDDPASGHEGGTKASNIDHLKGTFLRDQKKHPIDERAQWNGSASQMVIWHYEKTLARYFNVESEIKPLVRMMSTAGSVVFWGLIGAMILVLLITAKNGSTTYWLLVLPAIALPVLFLVDFSAWLWWYGHTLNDMGAFSVKPFMPTVFGQGKVAQFATHSYPHRGFGLIVLASVLLIIAANQRYKYFRSK